MLIKISMFVSLSVMLLCICPLILGQNTFTNVAKEAGVDGFIQSVAPVWGDYDNDGDLDLYVTGGEWVNMVMVPHVFYRNNGDGTFTEFTKEAGLAESKGDGRFAGFLDYDNDGYLDLLVSSMTWEANFANFKANILLYHNEGNGKFDEIGEDAGLKASNFATYSGGFLDYDNDGFLDLYIMQNWGPNILYKNKGNGEFVDVANDAGVVGKNDGGFNFTTGDYDNDGDMDIYIPGGGGGVDGPSVLFQNNGDGTFTDVTKKAGVSSIRRGRGSAFFDYDNDGDMDLFTASGTQSSLLYKNNGDGTFTEVAQKSGILWTPCERLTVGDYDNDGFVDMYLMPWGGTRILYRNKGDGTFTDATKEAGVGGSAIRCGGCAFGDYDNDGDLDIYASNLGGSNELFRNEGNSNHWLHIKLVGTRSNRDGVGARIKLVSGELSMIREISFGCARGHNVLAAHFGLGKNTVANSIEVRWPSGRIDTMQDIPADQFITVEEGKGVTKGEAVYPQGKLPLAWGKVKNNRLYQNYPNPFNPETWIPFQLTERTNVSIHIYNSAGQLIRTMDLGYREAGSYTSKEKAVYWDGRNDRGEMLPSDVYFYTMKAGGAKESRKMIMIR